MIFLIPMVNLLIFLWLPFSLSNCVELRKSLMGGNDGEGPCWTEADSAHPELSFQGFWIMLHFWFKSPSLLYRTGSDGIAASVDYFLAWPLLCLIFVISTFFFFLTFGCRPEKIPSHAVGSGIKTHWFCSVVLFHTSLRIKILSMCLWQCWVWVCLALMTFDIKNFIKIHETTHDTGPWSTFVSIFMQTSLVSQCEQYR